MSKRFLVIGGPVRSINDGQIHNISSTELVRLYGLKDGEYKAIDGDYPVPKGEWTILMPRSKGDYEEYIEKIRLRS